MRQKRKIITNFDEVPVIFDLAYASVLVGVCIVRLRQLSAEGKFPAFKIGNQWRVKKDDFMEWIKKE